MGGVKKINDTRVMHSSITLKVGSSSQEASRVLCSEVVLRHLRMLQATTEVLRAIHMILRVRDLGIRNGKTQDLVKDPNTCGHLVREWLFG